LSFTVRDKKCNAGIVLTASHNPPEYNGYKVYWNDGAQVVPPNDNGIISEVEKTQFNEIKFNGNDDLIEWIGADRTMFISMPVLKILYIRTLVEIFEYCFHFYPRNNLYNYS
jgi:phosphomannomutase